uniref:MH2 domain-containing protein n=1 Tax=Panagrolaimus superbus TaxID=310955 RepID=A0A914YJK6_9BILA
MQILSGDKPLFICLSQSHKSENIRRLSPGYCIRVYRIPTDNESPRYTTTPRQNSFDPANSMSILTISVARGWGINYQRLFVTDMPCRYEIIFT